MTENDGAGVEAAMPDVRDALRRVTALLKAVADHSPDAICAKDESGRYLLLNASARRLIGKSAADVLGKDDLAIFPLHVAQAAMDDDRYVMTSGVSRTRERVLAVDGVERTYISTKTPFYDEQGNLAGVMETLRDAAPPNDVGDHPARSESILRQVLDALPIGVGVTDMSGDIVLSNPASQRIWGSLIVDGPQRFAASKGWRHESGKQIAPDEWASFRAFTRGETSLNELIDIEAFDGTRKVIRNSAVPLRDDDRTIVGAVVLNEDVTDVLQLERRFHRAQKMEAIGHLAAGIAHDFNNMLNVISIYTDLQLSQCDPTDARFDSLSQIREAGEQAAGLTRQLLAFSRKVASVPKILNLNDVVCDNYEMLRRLVGENVVCTFEPDPELKRVKIDPVLISQVLVNLAINARDAMPSGGWLGLKTRNIFCERDFAVAHPEAGPGWYAILTVSDNGCGITPDVRPHLFEPFFTTKDADKGTGLGLAAVYGVIKRANGFISVSSELGLGTTFDLFLPATTEDDPSRNHTSVTRPVPQGIETILLVEDEDAVRSTIHSALRQVGYRIIDANRGPAAIELFEKHEGPIDLVITDVVMPEMNGRQMVERIRRMRPELRVLYVSGYTEEAVVRQGVSPNGAAFLQKPFTMSALATKVRQLLDDPA